MSETCIQEANSAVLPALEDDYDHLARRLARQGVDAEALVERAMAFKVAVPTWGLGSGGTRFARFAIPGEPRNVFERLEDCEVVLKLTRATRRLSSESLGSRRADR